MNLPARKYDVTCFGEMLWDVLPGCELPGGAPFNVAYHLKKLGIEPLVISRIGKDKRGEDLLEKLSSNDIDFSHIQIDDIEETGWVNATKVSDTEMKYNIVHPVAWDFIEWQESFVEKIASSKFFVYGSLASRSSISKKTLYNLLDLPLVKVLDINLRPPHFNKQGIDFLLDKADILKLNESELEHIKNGYGSSDSYEEMALQVQDRYSIPTIIVTLGSKGAMIVHEGCTYQHSGFSIKVADTIGSGDSFLAGFLSQLIKGADINSALKYSCAIGALIATLPGGCPDYNSFNIQQILAGDELQNSSSFF